MMDRKEMMNNIGNRIKQVRKREGLTQEDLADVIGVSRTAIARWELGEIEPKIRNLIALAKELDVSTDYLLGIDKESQLERLGLSDEAYAALKALIGEIRKDQQ